MSVWRSIQTSRNFIVFSEWIVLKTPTLEKSNFPTPVPLLSLSSHKKVSCLHFLLFSYQSWAYPLSPIRPPCPLFYPYISQYILVAAVVEGLSSCIAGQEVRGSNYDLATWIIEIQGTSISWFQIAIWLKSCKSDVNPQNNPTQPTTFHSIHPLPLYTAHFLWFKWKYRWRNEETFTSWNFQN